MRLNRNVFAFLVVMIGFGDFATRSDATVIYTQSPYQTTAFAVSSTDLINGLMPVAISGTNDQEGLNSDTTGAALTDGTFGPSNPYVVGGSSSMTIVNNGASITYALAAPAAISEIDSYSGWQDGGRSQQNYTISVSTNGVDYTLLGTVNAVQDPYGGPYPPENKPSDDEVAVTSSTGVLATGVVDVRFDFPSVENGYVGYTELDVIAAVPEPTSLTLLAIGALGLIFAARRHRTAGPIRQFGVRGV